MRKYSRFLLALFSAIGMAIYCAASPNDEATALTAAERFLQTSKMAARTLPDRSVESIGQRGNLWVVRLAPSGHILLSGSDRATPIIGFSQNDFSEGEEDSAERAMLDAADAAVAAAEADETKGRHARWDKLLAEPETSAGTKVRKLLSAGSGSGSDINIEPFVDSKYNQNQPWNDLTPVSSKVSDYIWRGRSCAGCVSIADAAIFRELQWPKYPARTETVTHNLRGENFAIRFNGSVPFDWSKMSDTYSYSGDMRGKTGAEEDKRYEIGRYVLWLNQSASMSYNVGESTSTKYTSAHGAERDWYTIGYSSGNVTNTEGVVKSDVVEKVTQTLSAGIPVFVGIGGHAVVADGWGVENEEDYVHLVYGYGGNASDKFYNVKTGPVHYFWLDHYPRAKPQLDPIPRVVGNSVTLSWSFPDCYADKNYMFYIKGKRRTSNEVIDWTADFSDATTGSAYPANIWYATNNYGAASISLDAEDLTYGFYQFSTPLTITSDSELSFKISGGAHKSGDACKDNVVIEICGEDGNWHELFVPEINWAYWPGTWKENTKSLAEYAGQTVQLRIYKRHATYNGHVVIGDFKVTDVIPLTGENVFEVALATDRSKTINGLANGSDYYFSVTPYVYGALVDGEPSDAKITTCSSGASSEMPALFTSIQYAADGKPATDLVDGYLADGSIGSSTLYVTTPTTVTALTATPSHVELVKDANVHVTEASAGNWEITFDPVIPANRDRQRMILTLNATDTNGTTVHRDVVMRMTEDKIVVGEGETWTMNDDYELTRSLVMAGGTIAANDTFAINQNGISSFTVVSNSTINGTGKLSIAGSNATITFENSKSLTNSLNIESANEETLTLAGTGTFVQEAGTTIKVYDMSVGEHVLLNLNLTSDQSTSEAIVQFGNGMASITDWKLRIDAPTDMPKGTYPLIYASTYLSKPTTIYLPNLDRECSVEVKNSNTLNFVVGDPKSEQVTDTDYPVPYSWFTDMGVPASYIDTIKNSQTSSGYKWWECYVLGLNPMGSGTFTATLTMNGSTPVITYSPTNETLVADATMPITYVLQGNASDEGGEWVDTSFDNPGSNYVRFRVDVRWTNGETKHIYSNEVVKSAEPEPEPTVAPTPIAAWNKDFRRTVDGCSLDWHGNTFGDDRMITIATVDGNEYQGVDVNLASGVSAITALVKYSDLVYNSNVGRVFFTSCAESEKAHDRTTLRLTVGNQIKASKGDNTGAATIDVGTGDGEPPASSGVMAFTYDGTTLLCSGSEGAINATNFVNSIGYSDDANSGIYGATIGGLRMSTRPGQGWDNATGMKIEAIAVFDKKLTEEERNAYTFPEPVIVNFTIVVPEHTAIEVAGATLVSGNGYWAYAGDEVTINYAAVGAYIAGGTQVKQVTPANEEVIAAPEDYTTTAAVAQIGTQSYYATLAAAMSAATTTATQDAPLTVKMLCACTEAADITIPANVALDLNGYGITSGAKVILAGGALVNNGISFGNANTAVVAWLELTADSTIGGSGNFYIRETDHAESKLTLNGHTLTKNGTNTLTLDNTQTAETVEELGTISVSGGHLGIYRVDNTYTGVNLYCNVVLNNSSSEFFLSANNVQATVRNLSGNGKITGWGSNRDLTVTGTLTLPLAVAPTPSIKLVDGAILAFTSTGLASGYGNKLAVAANTTVDVDLTALNITAPVTLISWGSAPAGSFTTDDLASGLKLVKDTDGLKVEAAPSIAGDPDAVVTGDAENGYTVTPSASTADVVVEIPANVEANKVTVRVASTANSYKANGANVQIIGGNDNDIKDFLQGLTPDTEGVVDLAAAKVKDDIVAEVFTGEGANVFLGGSASTITTAKTKPGLTYNFRQGATLQAMLASEPADTTIGNSEAWTPNPSGGLLGGSEAFYSVEITK